MGPSSPGCRKWRLAGYQMSSLTGDFLYLWWWAAPDNPYNLVSLIDLPFASPARVKCEQKGNPQWERSERCLNECREEGAACPESSIRMEITQKPAASSHWNTWAFYWISAPLGRGGNKLESVLAWSQCMVPVLQYDVVRFRSRC